MRKKLEELEKRMIRDEKRFSEVQREIGFHQSADLYPSVVGFNRVLLHLILSWVRPPLLAAIIVFIDVNWVAILANLAL